MGFPRAALFDLDGTLLDSAPDLLAAINAMRAERGREPILLADLRPHVSRGGRAMIGAAFGDVDATERDAWIPELLSRYEAELGCHGGPFEGIEDMLRALESAGVPWGIVTNKPVGLARLLMPIVGWESRCKVLLGGDSLPRRKPDPDQLLAAAEQLGVDPRACAYVGDDERDIVAARAAGMPSVVALWGYRLSGDDPFAWQGDVLVDEARALCDPGAWPGAR